MSLRSLACSLLLTFGVAACHGGSSAPTTPDPAGCMVEERVEAPPEPAPVEAPLCGSRGLSPCAEGLVCIHPVEAHCGETDAPGHCMARPEMCTMDYNPVCGCDGRTYGNACGASAAGVSVRAVGECP